MLNTRQSNLSFRYDINALRAIAVLEVLFFHLRFAHFPGGFAGVDIFFVISGYLMTKIIVGGIRKGNFSILDFYTRRVRRIIPALLVAVGIVTLAAFIFYLPADFKNTEGNAASSVTFLSNFYYWQHSGYFDTASESNIFLHTWTLSVEWQFYMIYPLLLLALARLIKHPGTFRLLFTLLTLLCCGLSILLPRHDAAAAFYLLPSRSWELMMGGVAFLYEDRLQRLPAKKLLVLPAYAIALIGSYVLKETMRWPGVYTLLPILSTFFIIGIRADGLPGLHWKPVQYLGKISYSLYLWHWPVIVFARYMGLPKTMPYLALLILVSFLLAALSYHFVESIDFRPRKLLWTAGALFAFTVGLSFIGNAYIFKPKAVQLSRFSEIYSGPPSYQQFSTGCCFLVSNKEGLDSFNKPKCLTLRQDEPNILLIGDSHGAHISQSLRESLAANHINLCQATGSGCIPLTRPLTSRAGFPEATDLFRYIYQDFIPANHQHIDGIILSANWIDLIQDNPAGLLKHIQSTLGWFDSLHIKAVVIGQNEAYTQPYATILAKETQYGSHIRRSFIDDRSTAINAYLKGHLGDRYIDILNDTTIPGLSPQGDPYMFDRNHYTKYGADLAVRKIVESPLFPFVAGRPATTQLSMRE